MCAPEIGWKIIIAVNTDRPKVILIAKGLQSRAMDPQPIRTIKKVPPNSAKYLFHTSMRLIVSLMIVVYIIRGNNERGEVSVKSYGGASKAARYWRSSAMECPTDIVCFIRDFSIT